MSMAVIEITKLSLVGLSLLFVLPANADSFLYVQIDQSLPSDARLAIAEILEPGVDHQVIFDAASQARLITQSLEAQLSPNSEVSESDLRVALDIPAFTVLSPPIPGIVSQHTRRDTLPPGLRFRLPNDRLAGLTSDLDLPASIYGSNRSHLTRDSAVVYFPEPEVLEGFNFSYPSTDDGNLTTLEDLDENIQLNNSFLVLDRDSDILRAYDQFSDASNYIDSSFDEIFDDYIIPLDFGRTSQLPGFQVGVLAEASASLVYHSEALSMLAAIARDVEADGFSARTFELNDADNLSNEQLEAINSILAAYGNSNVRLVESAPDIEVDSYIPEVEQTSAAGGCVNHQHAAWPFDATEVAEVIRSNLSVFEDFGVRHFERSEIMIVDAGMPPWMAADPEVSRFLFMDPQTRLSPGLYAHGSASRISCTRRYPRALRHQYGFVAFDQINGRCVDLSNVSSIAPPRNPVSGAERYTWDHGGFVGVLAAGGPELIASVDELERLVGLSFARIIRVDEGTGRLRSEANEVVSVLNFALQNQIPILNVSLRLEIDPNDKIFGALQNYWQLSDGLTIAAAGNSGGRLRANSRSFPAGVLEESSDNLIVVGGVHVSQNGSVGPWPFSSGSPELVDIAAPAASVPSYSGEGDVVCYQGTSVAAPQVSFVAAVLRSMGLTRPAAIKRRILATADLVPEVERIVRDGRVLNAPRALDIFSDLLWRNGAYEPERVILIGSPDQPDTSLVRLCSGSADLDRRGWIDLVRVHAVERLESDRIQVWYDARTTSGLSSGPPQGCEAPASSEIVILVDGREETISLADIDRLVPSRFRAAINPD